ncbi:inositol monophosphatase [Patescibacteria group bacterium]|nr:inositol monophosphatase [Patescibacteria group bacterium]
MSIFRQTAIKAARQAGQRLMVRFNSLKSSEIHKKGPHDLVTRADMEANDLIISTIKSKFPNHDILSEETGLEDNPGNYKWVIDPLDGTINFSIKSPLFCTALALVHRRSVLLGIIYSPFTNEFFIAEKGRGAYLNKKKIRVSRTRMLIDSLILVGRTHHPRSHKNFIKILGKLEKRVLNVRRLGSGSLDLAYTAAGRTGGTILTPPGLTLWDSAAGALMVKEAGGRITDGDGKPWSVNSDGLVASNGKIHNQLVRLVKSCSL